jgi:murein DD-endopeptidase MepM/ murein hydrolase activator NlpD
MAQRLAAVRRRSVCFRPRLAELEDRTVPTGNLHITGAHIVDANDVSETAPVTGQMVYVEADYTSTNMSGGEQMIVGYTIDGVSVDGGAITAPAGNGSWAYYRGGWYAAPGTHSVTCMVDPHNAITETDETDNSFTFQFTTVSPTDLPSKFIRPISGTLGQDWAINNYADVDPRSGSAADYRGGPYQYDGHDAIDAQPWGFDRQDAGIPIYAAADGVVSAVVDGLYDRNTAQSNLDGNHVWIDHGNNWQTLYYHFAKNTITVKVGDHVKAGQVIGLMGSSGSSTSTHLHFTPYYRGCEVEMGYDTATYETNPMPYAGDAPAFLFDAGVTNYAPTSDIGEHPSPLTSYSTTQGGSVYFWTTTYNLKTTDTLQWKYYRPDSTLFSTDTLNPSQNYRFSWWYNFHPLSQFAASPGTWQIAWVLDGVEQKRVSFSVTANGAAPAARVTDPSNNIVLNMRETPEDFGSVAAGGTAPTETFTINNHGGAALTVANVVLPPGFSLVSAPSSVAAGSSGALTIRLDTGVVGSKFGAVRFDTNDPLVGTYDFNVSGTVTGSAPAGSPVVTLADPAVAYNFGGPPKAISPDATVADSNSANFNGGSLVVDFAAGGAATDRLGILNQGPITVIGSNVLYNSTPIGTFAGGAGLTPLVVTFNANATPAAAQALAQAVAYANVSATPLTAPRWARFTLTDDTGLVSNLAVITVVNTGVAVAPTVQSVQVNDGTAQRSEVRSITVTFSSGVTFAGGNAAAAFQLLHIQTAVNVMLSATVTADAFGRTIVTFGFSGSETDPVSALNGGIPSLADGRYQLTVPSGNVTGVNGQLLDGDNNGTAGGTYVSPTDTYLGNGLHLYRLFGDVDGDGVVDATDVGQLKSTFNRNNTDPLYLSFLDADNSGSVDAQDVGQFKSRFNVNVF